MIACGLQARPNPADRERVRNGTKRHGGREIRGPAIIEEASTALGVYPAWEVTVDDAGDYTLRDVG